MDPGRKLIASDAETGEYREGTVLYLSDPTLPAGYRASFVGAVEVLANHYTALFVCFLSKVHCGRRIRFSMRGLCCLSASVSLVVFSKINQHTLMYLYTGRRQLLKLGG